MNEQTIDELVASSARYDDAEVARLGLRDAQQELLAEIMATSVQEVGEPSHRGRSTLLVAVAAAVVLVVALPVWLVGHRGDESPVAAAPTKSTEVMQENLHILLDAPGWRVASVGDGSIAFAMAKKRLEVNAYPAKSYSGYLTDRRDIGPATPVQALGLQGEMFRYRPGDFTTILRPRAGSFLELRGEVGDKAAYVDLLGQVERVPVVRWLAAMPASVVKPAEERSVADQMLADIPTPPGFDRATLPTGGANDYYQYGALVSGRVACGWLEDWVAARRTGDSGAAQRAVGAMRTSRSWAVLNKMNPQGDYPEVLWEYADQIAAGTFPTGYRPALGCHG